MAFPTKPRAVITGAGSGLGRALALELAGRSARLLLSDVDEAGCAETAEAARRQGAEVITTVCDVRDPEQVGRLAELAKEHWGGADILANNAGVAVAGPMGTVPLEDWKWVVDINLWGVIYGCHHFVPMMREQGGGYILNVASAAGLLAAPMMGPYNVTKAGVVSLSETLHTELKQDRIYVTALCPTFFRSQIHKAARAPKKETEQTEKLITKAKWSSEEIARVALAGLEKNQLYVIPQMDGKIMWRLKRLVAERFQDLVGAAMQMRWVKKRFGDDS
jgi:NAD(P)-dependent dehydrogenase (short-subunit alcohol dehydrogenase family)